MPEPVEYGEPISSQATTSPSIRQDQVPQRLFLPRQPELFCAAELFFSPFLRRWCNGQAAWQNQGK
jgi:hypothetical protein